LYRTASWLHRVPGGAGVANVFAWRLFAEMAGSSPAHAPAIGLRRHRKCAAWLSGGSQAALSPPAHARHSLRLRSQGFLFAVAAKSRFGVFSPASGPRPACGSLSAFTRCPTFARNLARRAAISAQDRVTSDHSRARRFHMAERFNVMQRVLRSDVADGVMIALMAATRTPSERRRLGDCSRWR